MPSDQHAPSQQLLDPEAAEPFAAAYFAGLSHPDIASYARGNIAKWLRKDPLARRPLAPYELKARAPLPAWAAEVVDRGERILCFAPSGPVLSKLSNIRDLLADLEQAASGAYRDGSKLTAEMRHIATSRLKNLRLAKVEDLLLFHDKWFADRVAAQYRPERVDAPRELPNVGHARRLDTEDGRFWIPMPADWLKTAGQRLKNCLAAGYYSEEVRSDSQVVYGLFTRAAEGKGRREMERHLLSAARFVVEGDRQRHAEDQAYPEASSAEREVIRQDVNRLIRELDPGYTNHAEEIFDGRSVDEFAVQPLGDGIELLTAPEWILVRRPGGKAEPLFGSNGFILEISDIYRTGAAGFLGAADLYQLLDRDSAAAARLGTAIDTWAKAIAKRERGPNRRNWGIQTGVGFSRNCFGRYEVECFEDSAYCTDLLAMPPSLKIGEGLDATEIYDGQHLLYARRIGRDGIPVLSPAAEAKYPLPEKLAPEEAERLATFLLVAFRAEDSDVARSANLWGRPRTSIGLKGRTNDLRTATPNVQIAGFWGPGRSSWGPAGHLLLDEGGLVVRLVDGGLSASTYKMLVATQGGSSEHSLILSLATRGGTERALVSDSIRVSSGSVTQPNPITGPALHKGLPALAQAIENACAKLAEPGAKEGIETYALGPKKTSRGAIVPPPRLTFQALAVTAMRRIEDGSFALVDPSEELPDGLKIYRDRVASSDNCFWSFSESSETLERIVVFADDGLPGVTFFADRGQVRDIQPVVHGRENWYPASFPVDMANRLGRAISGLGLSMSAALNTRSGIVRAEEAMLEAGWTFPGGVAVRVVSAQLPTIQVPVPGWAGKTVEVSQFTGAHRPRVNSNPSDPRIFSIAIERGGELERIYGFVTPEGRLSFASDRRLSWGVTSSHEQHTPAALAAALRSLSLATGIPVDATDRLRRQGVVLDADGLPAPIDAESPLMTGRMTSEAGTWTCVGDDDFQRLPDPHSAAAVWVLHDFHDAPSMREEYGDEPGFECDYEGKDPIATFCNPQTREGMRGPQIRISTDLLLERQMAVLQSFQSLRAALNEVAVDRRWTAEVTSQIDDAVEVAMHGEREPSPLISLRDPACEAMPASLAKR